jgi:prolyl-tRNA synthetase
LALGGTFSDFSHEFQTITPSGEDTIYVCKKCKMAYNKEVGANQCECGGKEFKEEKAIEVGNIFKLGAKYSVAFDLKDEKGKYLIMGCYGIGISRLMGAIVEVFNDDKGIIWPESVAPFSVHLISLDGGDSEIKAKADDIYGILQKLNLEVLYDNRDDKTAGEKLNDCDLIGIPIRIVVSKKTLEKDSVEMKKRSEEKTKLVKIKDLKNEI